MDFFFLHLASKNVQSRTDCLTYLFFVKFSKKKSHASTKWEKWGNAIKIGAFFHKNFVNPYVIWNGWGWFAFSTISVSSVCVCVCVCVQILVNIVTLELRRWRAWWRCAPWIAFIFQGACCPPGVGGIFQDWNDLLFSLGMKSWMNWMIHFSATSDGIKSNRFYTTVLFSRIYLSLYISYTLRPAVSASTASSVFHPPHFEFLSCLFSMHTSDIHKRVFPHTKCNSLHLRSCSSSVHSELN